MSIYLLDWAELLLRWLHLIAGVAWIGASFYFVLLDCSLRPPTRDSDRRRGVFGELWAVHGGGIYHSEKFLAGPRDQALPERLHWSKWEAYTTWLSGFSLLVLIYWIGAESWLIDPAGLALTAPQAMAASALVLAGGWLVYDLLCRLLGGREGWLALVLLLLAGLASWGLFQLFAARAAALHLGAMLGTLMAANVFFHIIPGQKKMLAEIRAGLDPNPEYGRIGKQRSVHNTYFTLPVLLVMISNHYPMLWSHEQGWLSLFLLALAGVLIRQFFVLRHSGTVMWRLPLLALLLIAGIIAWLKPVSGVALPRVGMTEARAILDARCVACHSANPSQPGFAQPPKDIRLDSDSQARRQAARIAQTVASGYMPLGNLTGMSDEERRRLVAWARGVEKEGQSE